MDSFETLVGSLLEKDGFWVRTSVKVELTLIKQLVSSGACAASPSVMLCLAAGKVASESDREKITALFSRNGWRFFDDSWLRERLMAVSNSGYENEVASVVAKILLRGQPRHNKPLEPTR